MRETVTFQAKDELGKLITISSDASLTSTLHALGLQAWKIEKDGRIKIRSFTRFGFITPIEATSAPDRERNCYQHGYLAASGGPCLNSQGRPVEVEKGCAGAPPQGTEKI